MQRQGTSVAPLGCVAAPREIHLMPRDIAHYEPYVGAAEIARAAEAAARLRERLAGGSVWNINSAERGGGVAELLRSLVAYARGAEVDVRWAVIGGPPEFFLLTKRLHNALHGIPADPPLGPEWRALYERVSAENAAELAALVDAGDVVILHDPQTAGLAPALIQRGARVIWRCHIGRDEPDAEVGKAWSFLLPYLENVPLLVFSRKSYVPAPLAGRQSALVPPTIDPLSTKNQPMAVETVRAILVHVGLIGGDPGPGPRHFYRDDGTPGRVDRCAEVTRLGRPPAADVPLVVQVSRWDHLKDPIGVMQGFAQFASRFTRNAELVLAGPDARGVADDPEGAQVFQDVVAAWRQLPSAVAQRVHLANLPMADIDENAAIVNALQRHAALVVQKSLVEGFGLTLTEAMWKGRPVIASRVGGLQDQIEHGVSGLLLADPRDPRELADLLARVLDEPQLAARLGAAAVARVRDNYLGFSSLIRYAELIERVLDGDIPPGGR